MANIKISELSPLITVQDADVLPIVDNAITKKVTAAILRSYTEGNSVLLTGAQTVAGIKTFTAQLASTVATGTAPFSVASTTKVTNLNADLLDGLSSADFALSTRTLTAGTGLTGGGDLTANRTFAIDSTVATLTGTQTLTNKTLTSPVINEILDSNGNEILGFTPIASATDYITIKNGIGVGVPLHISAAGSSTNTGLHLEPKGSGLVQISDGTDTTKGFRFRSSASATGAVTLIDAVSSAGRVITLPNATTTLVGTNTTDTLTNKSIAGDTNTLSNIGNASLTNSAITINGTSTSLGGSINVGTVTSVAALTLGTSGTDLTSTVATGTTTPVITLNVPTASASNRGALSSTDWSTFNGKQNAITLTTTGTSGAATLVGSTLNIPNYADTDTGITSLNGLTALTQTFAVGTSGSDFGISSATSTHTFNLPTASAANRGALSSADWTTFNNKQNALTNPITGTGTNNYLPKFTGASALGNSLVYDNGTSIGIGTTSPSPFALVDSNGQFRVSNLSVQGFYQARTSDAVSEGVYGGNSFVLRNGATSEDLNFDVFNRTSSAWYTPLIIKNTGNVGIGTTSPAYTLDVNGTARVSGVFSANNSITIGDGTTASNSSLSLLGVAGVSFTWSITNDANGLSIGGGTSPSLRLNGATGAATFSSSVTATQFTADSRTKVGGGYIADMGGAGNDTGIFFGANTILPSNGSGTITTKDLGSATYPWGAATFSADATINGVTVGKGAGNVITNTVVGANALINNSTGFKNVAIGRTALFTNGTGSDNTSVGFQSLYENTSGSFNCAFGENSLLVNTTGSNNTSIGYASLFNNTASSNTAVGFEAGYSNTSGTGVTAIGYQALRLSTGNDNTALGFQSLAVTTTGANNTALGRSSLTANITGSVNVAVGDQSLASNTSGNSNVAIGYGVDSGNFDASVILGRIATATASNQFVVGSATYPAGAVATEVNASTKVWNVRINGVAQKILLA